METIKYGLFITLKNPGMTSANEALIAISPLGTCALSIGLVAIGVSLACYGFNLFRVATSVITNS